MGNHASQDRSNRSKGGDLGQYGGGRGEDKPFIIHPRTQQSQSTAKPRQQGSEEEQSPVLLTEKQDKENDDPAPQRVGPVITQGNKKMLPVVIKWTGGGSNVAIAGTFNQWQKIPMVKSEKDFVAIVDLPEGSHQYKFVVDGEWKVNKNDSTTTNNNTNTNTNTSNTNNNNKSPGTENNNNNVITISETDFEEFETALLPDPNDKSGDKERIHGSSGGKEKGGGGNEEDEFGQVIPEYQQSDKIRGPPVLPPHLLQVILNKDTPISCEPTLLPEPNHVMLNHMYALSIRDGMMVLSTSNRYRKKCVTTLIYRPIE